MRVEGPDGDPVAEALRLLTEPAPEEPVKADQQRPLAISRRPPRRFDREQRLPGASWTFEDDPRVAGHGVEGGELLLRVALQLGAHLPAALTRALECLEVGA